MAPRSTSKCVRRVRRVRLRPGSRAPEPGMEKAAPLNEEESSTPGPGPEQHPKPTTEAALGGASRLFGGHAGTRRPELPTFCEWGQMRPASPEGHRPKAILARSRARRPKSRGACDQ